MELTTYAKVTMPPIRIPIVQKRQAVALKRNPPISEVFYTEPFQKNLPGPFSLTPTEERLVSVWLAPGSWRVGAYCELLLASVDKGGVGSDAAWTNAQIVLRAEPSDLYPEQWGGSAAGGYSVALSELVLHVRSADAMFVTFSASDWGPEPGVLRNIKFFGVPG